MKDPCYSPEPQAFYVAQGIGALLADDLQRWNWHYTMKGPIAAEAMDAALLKHWHEDQHWAMTWPPADALNWLVQTMPTLVTEEVKARLLEAQARLFAPKVERVEGTVIYANFKRRQA